MTTAWPRSDAERGSSMPCGTIVVVEDRLVSNLVRAVLRKHGYEVTLLEAPEAAALLRSPDSNVGALITNAPSAFLEFAERVPLLYLSSLPDPLLQASFSACQVVVKPFAPEDLAQAVSALIASL